MSPRKLDVTQGNIPNGTSVAKSHWINQGLAQLSESVSRTVIDDELPALKKKLKALRTEQAKLKYLSELRCEGDIWAHNNRVWMAYLAEEPDALHTGANCSESKYDEKDYLDPVSNLCCRSEGVADICCAICSGRGTWTSRETPRIA